MKIEIKKEYYTVFENLYTAHLIDNEKVYFLGKVITTNEETAREYFQGVALEKSETIKQYMQEANATIEPDGAGGYVVTVEGFESWNCGSIEELIDGCRLVLNEWKREALNND